MIEFHRSLVHPEYITTTHYRVLAITLVLLHVITWTACYIVSSLDGHVTERIFFLSRAMSYDPSRSISNFMVPLVAFTGLIIIILRAVSLADRCVERKTRTALGVFLVSGYIMSQGLIAVSAIPYTLWKLGHLIVAGVVFAVGLVTIAASCLVDYWTVPTQRIHKLRWLIFLTALVASIGSGGTYYVLVELSAVFEIIGAAVMVVFLVSIARIEAPPTPIEQTEESDCIPNPSHV